MSEASWNSSINTHLRGPWILAEVKKVVIYKYLRSIRLVQHWKFNNFTLQVPPFDLPMQLTLAFGPCHIEELSCKTFYDEPVKVWYSSSTFFIVLINKKIQVYNVVWYYYLFWSPGIVQNQNFYLIVILFLSK